VLVLDLLAIRAEKRFRSFRNGSVPASVAAERAAFSITSTSTISNGATLPAIVLDSLA
jgi:hypothetical protein